MKDRRFFSLDGECLIFVAFNATGVFLFFSFKIASLTLIPETRTLPEYEIVYLSSKVLTDMNV